MSGATGGTNISMNSPINIKGVSTDRQGAVGAEVQKALQDPINTLLTQFKTARAQEARLGYV